MAESAAVAAPPKSDLIRPPITTEIKKGSSGEEKPQPFNELGFNAFSQSLDALADRSWNEKTAPTTQEKNMALDMVKKNESLMAQAFTESESSQMQAISNLSQMLDIASNTGNLEIGNSATDLLQKNLILMDQLFKTTKDKSLKGMIMSISERSLQHQAKVPGKEKDIHNSVNFMIANFPQYFQEGASMYTSRALDTIFAYSQKSQLDSEVPAMLEGLFKNPDLKVRQDILLMLRKAGGNVDIGAHKETNLPLSQVSAHEQQKLLDLLVGKQLMSDLGQAWKSGNGGYEEKSDGKLVFNLKKQYDYIVSNKETVLQLETERPGAVKTLYDQFRIRNFARYPLSVLIKQYDDRNKTDRPFIEAKRERKYSTKYQKEVDVITSEPNKNNQPYVIALYPDSDHNGAFSTNKAIFEKLSRQLEAHGMGLVIIESGDRDMALKQLMALRRLKGKASSIIVGGHGKIEGIKLGEGKEGDLTLMDLIGSESNTSKGKKFAKMFLKENSTAIFASCSTGSVNSNGEGMAKAASEYGIEVHAPDIDTNILSIDLDSVNEGGVPSFITKYKDAKDMHYKNGQLLAA